MQIDTETAFLEGQIEKKLLKKGYLFSRDQHGKYNWSLWDPELKKPIGPKQGFETLYNAVLDALLKAI